MAKKKANPVRMCLDMLPPPDERERFRDLAYAEDATNVVAGVSQSLGLGLILPIAATSLYAKKWQTGRTLKIAFMGGTSKQQEFTAKIANQWAQHANLTFHWGVPTAQSDIRIAYRPADGSWSYIGTDCAGIAKGQATMNLGWLDQAVVLHEWGHALSLVHEHQHPEGKIPWNKPAVYKALAGPPNYWDRETVDHNYFAIYEISQTQYTQFDRSSIMLYAIEAGLVTGPSFAVGWNTELSALDSKLISDLYPRAVTPPPGKKDRTIVVRADGALVLDGKEV